MDRNINYVVDLQRTIRFFFDQLRRLNVLDEFISDYCEYNQIPKSVFMRYYVERMYKAFSFGVWLDVYEEVIHPRQLLSYAGMSFTWSKSHNGYKYWHEINEKLRDCHLDGRMKTYMANTCTIKFSKHTSYPKKS